MANKFKLGFSKESHLIQDKFEKSHILVQGNASFNLPVLFELSIPHCVEAVHEFPLLSVPWLPLGVPNLSILLLRFLNGHLNNIL